ncbi:transmembrane emp24 domain-containing protein 10-like [Paramacrobiotus metropolitanus]|uniref:transmembrane emp24 domain-containing protein 10-like n=1 Tax=Paramacrobiotus metropolitanus TaxID=2943436 RepID=UPI002445808B|nr:transmembrane emp24 domain-containing protein 10-like [Paramacrobiotus metropolitanus]
MAIRYSLERFWGTDFKCVAYISFLPLFFTSITRSLALEFILQVSKPRCLHDDVVANIFINGLYNVTPATAKGLPYVPTSLQVTDSNGQIVYWKSVATNGKFVFVVDKDDKYSVCFESTLPNDSVTVHGSYLREKTDRRINLTLTNTFSFNAHRDRRQRDWMAFNVTTMEKELLLLQEFSQILHYSMSLMNEVQYKIRLHRQKTESVLLGVSVMGMTVLCGLAVWQLWYLRNFFKSKNIIE